MRKRYRNGRQNQEKDKKKTNMKKEDGRIMGRRKWRTD